MRLILAKTFIQRHFGEPIDERTVRDWVRKGEVDGREIGRRVYVDEEAFLESTGDPLADAILKARHQPTSRGGRPDKSVS